MVVKDQGGELLALLRALELLGWVQGKVLRLAALEAEQTEHWVNPARLAETRLPPELLFRYARLTTGLTPLGALESAYAEAVNWTLDLAARLGLPLSPALAAELRAWTQERA